jgi:hypothetical protein
MADFNYTQYVAPVQKIETDTSGGDAGDSTALAFGYNKADAGDGGTAVGGDSGDANGGDGNGWAESGRGGDSEVDSEGGNATQTGLLNLNLFSDVEGGDSDVESEGGDSGPAFGLGAGGDGGTTGRGGDATSNGGDALALNETEANSSADGGNGGDAVVVADQDTTVRNDFDFTNSFNENNDTNTYKNSFNEDNDGIDNAGGQMNGSVVAGDDIDDSLNSEENYDIDRSFNTDNSRTNIDASDDDEYRFDIEDSFNQEDNDFLDLDIRDNFIDVL